MKKLPFEVHPAANIFPMIKGKSFDKLVEDIRENGVNESIAFWNGKLLDGRNRSMACLEIGIDPLDHAVDLDPETDPVAYVLSANLRRRHLTETEREGIAAKIATLEHGNVKAQHSDPSNDGSKSVAAAAEQLNVSAPQVERNKAARKGGCEELVESLDAGEIPSSTAAKFVKAFPDKEEQAKIFKHGLPAVREAIKSSTPTAKKAATAKPPVVEEYEDVEDDELEPMSSSLTELRKAILGLQYHELVLVHEWTKELIFAKGATQ